MTITVDNAVHYMIPGTEDKYYISTTGDVYSAKNQVYIAKEGNTVRLTIDGNRARYNCDKLLVEALLAHIEYIKSII